MMLVYSCSGASNVAQLANHIAVRLDRAGVAQMSCIAGVGGDVKSLVRTAVSGRQVIAVDGCPLRCTERVLEAKGVTPEHTIRLHDRGLRKRHHTDFPDAERDQVLRDVLTELAPTLLAEDPAVGAAIDDILNDGGAAR